VETRSVGLWMFPVDAVRDRAKLASAVLRYYDESGAKPDTMTIDGERFAHRAFKPAAYRAAMSDPSVRSIALWSQQDDSVAVVRCVLRWFDPQDREFDSLSVTLISMRSPFAMAPTLRAFVGALVNLYPVAQGFVGGFRSHVYANKECLLATYSPLDLDEDTRARLKLDNRHLRLDVLSKTLRRLYPVTIIGPGIWSRLPPMPKVEHPPVIEDLGDCKMITAWPDLVEPRDPAFLAGTVELRRWLWPFTLQNPADAVELDSTAPRPR